MFDFIKMIACTRLVPPPFPELNRYLEKSDQKTMAFLNDASCELDRLRVIIASLQEESDRLQKELEQTKEALKVEKRRSGTFWGLFDNSSRKNHQLRQAVIDLGHDPDALIREREASNG